MRESALVGISLAWRGNKTSAIDCMYDAECRAVPATTRRKLPVPAFAEVSPGLQVRRLIVTQPLTALVLLVKQSSQRTPLVGT